MQQRGVKLKEKRKQNNLEIAGQVDLSFFSIFVVFDKLKNRTMMKQNGKRKTNSFLHCSERPRLPLRNPTLSRLPS